MNIRIMSIKKHMSEAISGGKAKQDPMIRDIIGVLEDKEGKVNMKSQVRFQGYEFGEFKIGDRVELIVKGDIKEYKANVEKIKEAYKKEHPEEAEVKEDKK